MNCNHITPKAFRDLQLGDDFISPEGLLCRKTSDRLAQALESDNVFGPGDTVDFAPDDGVEFVPAGLNAHDPGNCPNCAKVQP